MRTILILICTFIAFLGKDKIGAFIAFIGSFCCVPLAFIFSRDLPREDLPALAADAGGEWGGAALGAGLIRLHLLQCHQGA